MLDSPLVPSSDLVAYAEKLKEEDPRYGNVRITPVGPTRISLELEQVQNPSFWLERPRLSITVPVRDAKRLATVLEQHTDSDAESAAAKIRNAMQLGDTTTVELDIGEDTAVIGALEELQRSGDFGEALSRLLRELKKKLEQESV
jgi:hypothetical protein